MNVKMCINRRLPKHTVGLETRICALWDRILCDSRLMACVRFRHINSIRIKYCHIYLDNLHIPTYIVKVAEQLSWAEGLALVISGCPMAMVNEYDGTIQFTKRILNRHTKIFTYVSHPSIYLQLGKWSWKGKGKGWNVTQECDSDDLGRN